MKTLILLILLIALPVSVTWGEGATIPRGAIIPDRVDTVYYNNTLSGMSSMKYDINEHFRFIVDTLYINTHTCDTVHWIHDTCFYYDDTLYVDTCYCYPDTIEVKARAKRKRDLPRKAEESVGPWFKPTGEEGSMVE